MSRFLLAAVPVPGHVNPVLTLVRPLVEAGHQVRFLTGRVFADQVGSAGARFLPLPAENDYDWRDVDAAFPQRAGLGRIARLKFDMEQTLVAPSARNARHIMQLLAEEPADALVCDLGFVAAGLVQALGGPPLALCGVTILPFTSTDVAPPGFALGPLGGPLGRLRNRLLNALVIRSIFGGTTRELNTQRRQLGLPPAPGHIFSPEVIRPELFLQFCPPGFEFPRRDLPSTVHFVGSVPQVTPEGWAAPAWWADLLAAREAGRPVVVVSQGTVANDDPSELLRPTLDGLAGSDMLVVAATGGADPSILGTLPGNARAASYIPFSELFPLASVVVSNGGYGAVQAALGAGVPLVVAGRTEDKGDVAARVGWAGCGVDLRTGRARPAAVRDAVLRVLSDPGYRLRAGVLREQAPPATATKRAVALLEQLADTARPVVDTGR